MNHEIATKEEGMETGVHECSTCRFWLRTPTGPHAGECHRYPPRIVQEGDGGECHLSLWPEAEDCEFCGEWRGSETFEREATRKAAMSLQKILDRGASGDC